MRNGIVNGALRAPTFFASGARLVRNIACLLHREPQDETWNNPYGEPYIPTCYEASIARAWIVSGPCHHSESTVREENPPERLRFAAKPHFVWAVQTCLG